VVFSRMPGYRRQQVAGDYLNEQLEFISYLDDDAANGTNGDALSFGTAIEEYLL